jgi:hypothetical protein
LAGLVSDETGTGALVFANSPTLVTPALGTPASGVVTNLTGTASININGTVGATTPSTGAFTTLSATARITQSGVTAQGANPIGILVQPTAGNDATGTSVGIFSNFGLAPDTTATNLRQFVANQGAFNSGSSVTTQVGFLANSTLTGATNNYGFQGAIAAGSGRWNLYMSGTADNYLAGNVGIGTTSPTGRLNVVSASKTGGALTLEATDSTILAGDTLGTIDFYSRDPSSFATGIWGRIGTYATNDYGGLQSQVGTFMAFSTAASAELIERLRITDAGNVGIGTTAPVSRLNVALPVDTTGITLSAAANTHLNHIFFGDPDSNIIGRIGYNHADDSMRFHTNMVERLRITSAGNVGIGTTTPANLLHVKSSTSSTVALFGDSAANNTLAVTRTTSSPAYLAISATSSTGNIIGGPVLRLLTAGADGSGDTERARIDASGNVGIGTASPGSKLDVNGELRIGNTVNTVTPTLPNRTITMVIGGTTYYIHAKTTND